MKILQVMAGAEQGGAETAFVDICIALHEAGERVEVVTRPNAVRVPQLEQAGIKVHTAPFSGTLDVFTTWRLSRVITQFEPDIVQTWMARAAKKTPNWSQMKTPHKFLNVARLGGYYKIKNFKTADYFITNTEDLRRYVADAGIPSDRIRHINNFAKMVDTALPVHRSDLHTPDSVPVILSLGRLHENKAIDVAIKTMAEIPQAYLWIAGEGDLRPSLEQLARDMGVYDRVRFLGWRTDPYALLRASDVCLFPSRAEPFGNVVIQAWSTRTPLVVSDADGPRQICTPGEDCLMVPREDVSGFAKAIQRILSDKDLARRLTDRGHHQFQTHFTAQKTVSDYMGFYLEIMKREKMI
jgi:glycosyltransferase involved in cell wall biosynthesis